MLKLNKLFEFDYEVVKNKVFVQFKIGKLLLGKEGVFVLLFKLFLEVVLEVELENYLQENKEDESNW